jgi:hypothetical protein
MARPTKYKKQYCKKMLDFFSIEHTREIEQTFTNKKGETFTTYKEVANQLPTFERFAAMVGVCRDTLDEWKKQHKEFSDTYKKCKDFQKDMLNDLAMRGFYNPTYTIFVAKNITDMTDKQIVDNNVSYSLFEKDVERKAKEIE